MSFEKLLGELEALQTLKKSAPADKKMDEKAAKEADEADDKKILEAAAGAGGEAAEEAADEGDEPETGDEDIPADDDDEGEGEMMGKSFNFRLESGEEIEAIDGTELVKSLIARFDSTESAMTKALGGAIDLIKSQGEEISALKTEVKRLGSEGRGRKTVVSVAEKPAVGAMAKAEPAGVSSEEFMAKCLTAQSAGRITALDVAKAEGYLLKGLAVPADIVQRVLV